MKSKTFQHRLSTLAGLAVVLLSGTWAHAGNIKTVPTYEDSYFMDTDKFVNRAQSDVAQGDFKLGNLGVLLTSYGREPLFLAYRALTLEPAVLARQHRDTAKPGWDSDEITGGVPMWVSARTEAGATDLPDPIEQYKTMPNQGYGQYLNCANSAFNVAADTLKKLTQDAKVSKTDVMQWVQAQDEVFRFCADPKGAAPKVELTELKASAAPRLRALRQYQIAAAYFYAGDFSQALRRFDSMAADKAHPLRAWAALSAMRSMLRTTSLDGGLSSEIRRIRASQDAPPVKRAAFNLAQDKDRASREISFTQIQKRAEKTLADPGLKEIHPATTKLVAQAALMIAPEKLYAESSERLARWDVDMVNNRSLDDWVSLGDKLFDYGGNLTVLANLRTRHEFFDWIRTIQGCTDNLRSPNNTGSCVQEHAHAVNKWQSSRARTWLVAAVMTAYEADPTMEQVQQAAKQVTADAPEYLTLRYHLARYLRQNGHFQDAWATLAPVLDQLKTAGPKRSRSALNLLRQEAVANASSLEQALPYLLRNGGRALAADGDEMLNRRLSAQDLLNLAQSPQIEPALRDQLRVAAWWRADMSNNTALASAAAKAVAQSTQAVNRAAASYAASTDAGERRFQLAKAALDYNISPLLYWGKGDFGARRAAGPAAFWCSFNPADFAVPFKVQRTPEVRLAPSTGNTALMAELAAFENAGTGADWLGRIALERWKGHEQDPVLRAMLQAVIKSESLPCASPASAGLLTQAKQALGVPGANVNAAAKRTVPEAEIRAVYDRFVSAQQGAKEYQIFHIMLKSENEAELALAKLNAGASFESIAAAQSADPGSAAKGGALGWAQAQIFTPEFAAAVRATTIPGLYPKVVHTPFGWHIIRVQAERALVIPKFEQVRATIEAKLSAEPAKTPFN